MMTDIDNAIRAARAATEEASQVRQDALVVTTKACRALEKVIQQTLNSEALRGLKDIGSAGVVFYGIRIRAYADQKIPRPEQPGSAGKFLVLSHKGVLTNIWWDDDGAAPDGEALCEKPAEDSDLKVDDIGGLIQALRITLPRHVKAARKTNARYQRMQALAKQIIDVATGISDRQE